ncbi:MAG TPA: hypothetical protein VF630_19075 [Hymenobacter sp.]
MNFTVKLDNKLSCKADKICNKKANGVLAAELNSQLGPAQLLPKQCFCRRRLFAVLAGVPFRFAPRSHIGGIDVLLWITKLAGSDFH